MWQDAGKKLERRQTQQNAFELLKILAHGQPRVAHMVKTCNTSETHMKDTW